ncbi:dicarboxylate/amino acid:cation symporter [Paraferrimonas haliotis]|uniref:Sodium:glutamate symporter n=1 Tax=Paraferrimonas haliotis TaxID=2013866 RepID=A0AA37WXM0_9GAMM|nr:dicarboxylate/amino acid:cation symporter [Paraferrimonas haliotis]GLS82685.1 sodium:glutamate symporter [Paraferrimonas haliotis]
MNLIVKLLAGIGSGILVGLFAPDFLIRILLTAQTLIGQLIGFTIPLIIFFFIGSGIASMPANGKGLLSKTVAVAYSSTIFAGLVAFFVAITAVPSLTTELTVNDAQPHQLSSFIEIDVPAIFGVMSALALAFVFGIGASILKKTVLIDALESGKDVIDLLLRRVIVPILPLYISGVFADMAASGTVFDTLQTFGVVLIIALILHWAYISLLYLVTGLANGKSPLSLLKTMMPAYVTALGTMSSAATIPVSLRQVKANGVTPEVANVTVPLCASIHLAGSTITIVTCAMAVMHLSPELSLPSFADALPFIMMLGIVMIAAPGAPGGAVMSALGLLSGMMGFGEAAVGLMIALYLAQDSFGTACNVTCDGALSVWVDRWNQPN